MQYRRLGRSGLDISVIGLGSFYGSMADHPGDRGTRISLIRRAFDLGVNLFDTADVYGAGSEELLLGEAIRDLPRGELVVASKCGLGMRPSANGRGLSRKRLIESCNDSLRRLGLDHLDIYQFHAPDPDTPLEESVAAMDVLLRQGKVLYWGVSNYQEWPYQDLLNACRTAGVPPPVSNQIKYNLLRARVEEQLFPLLRRSGAGVLAYSPLEQGFLSGKYRSVADAAPDNRLGRRGAEVAAQILHPHNLSALDELRPLAAESGLDLVRLAFAWVLRDPLVACALTGITRPTQLEAAVAASAVTLPADLLAAIDLVLRRRIARLAIDDNHAALSSL